MTRRYRVSGQVQGVGFRYFVLQRASGLGLDGWVRNLPTGEVEVLARGGAAVLGQLEEAIRRGPRFSTVTNVDITEIQNEQAFPTGFRITD